MTRKLCGGCLRVKDYCEFHKNPSNSTGMHSRCAECTNRERREHRRSKPPTKPLFETREQSKAGTVILPKVPEAPADKKTQNRCHHRVAKAINMGVLSRPKRCTICRRTTEEVGVLHAHHEDYNNPLSVIFLCKSCHEIVHGRKRLKFGYCTVRQEPIKRLRDA